jgi:hypothetical protein
MNTFDIELSSEFVEVRDDMYQWRVCLKRRTPLQTRKFETTWSAGMAYAKNGKPTFPTLAQVLSSLQLDCGAGANLLFEDFCDDLGYDQDSRKAEEIWRACVRTRGEMMRLLGGNFDQFMAEEIEG